MLAREKCLHGSRRAEHQRISDPHEDDLFADQRLLEATPNDVKVGPLGHQSITASSHRGSGRSKRRAAHARDDRSCRRWNERTRGSPGISGFHERFAKYPDIPASDASIASARSGSTSSYQASTRSGSGPPSAVTPCAYAATSNSAGPTLANGQSKIRRRSPCSRLLSERVSKWSSTTSSHSSAPSFLLRANDATRASSPVFESSRQKPAKSWCWVRDSPRGRAFPRVLR